MKYSTQNAKNEFILESTLLARIEIRNRIYFVGVFVWYNYGHFKESVEI